MEKLNKFKLIIGLVYLLLICLFLYFFFSKFSLQEIMSYDFIKENKSYFFELKNSNSILIFFIFLILTILWVFPLLGFASPVAIMGGFIFGKWIGTLVVIVGLTIGATFMYIFANYFLKDFISKKFLTRYQNLKKKFEKSEFVYLFFYRMVGGIPWVLQCLLPTLFDVKLRNYFFSTLLGIVPGTFLIVSIGSGLEKIIDENSELPRIKDIIFSPEIYIPLAAFISLILISLVCRNFFYKD